MQQFLWKALGVCPGDVVAFTGGGGKTSSARLVARELQAAGRPAIFTTTTKIMPPLGMDMVLRAEAGLDPVRAALARGESVCLAERFEKSTGKLVGIGPEMVAELRSLGAGAVLVEADGSAMRPLKAPAPHEPVIPACADIVAPVAGASALGSPLDASMVHRPAETAAAAGVSVGSPITPAVFAAALLACTRGAPAQARIVPVLSQGDAAAPGLFQEVATRLLAQARIGRALLVAARTDQPVRAVAGDVSALVLAGGQSRRFGGGSKLLHPWGDTTLLEAALKAPLEAGLREVVVVTGAYHAELAALLERYPVRVVENPDWAEGMSTSLKVGLQALWPNGPGAAIVFMGDQPELPLVVPAALGEAHRRSGAPVVAPICAGRRRNPVLLDLSLLPELLAISGDEGARGVVKRHEAQAELIEFAHEHWFRDVDTRADLER